MATIERSNDHKRAWLGLTCVVLLLVTGGAALLLHSRADESPTFCSGVGLAAEESSSSPEIALSKFLATRPDLPPIGKWKRTNDQSDAVTQNPDYVVFKNPKHNGGYVGGFATVMVVRGGMNLNTGGRFPADQWSVDGACVGPPPSRSS